MICQVQNYHDAELAGMGHQATEHSPQHVAAALVRRKHAVGHEEGGGPAVVRDDAKADVVSFVPAISAARQPLGCRPRTLREVGIDARRPGPRARPRRLCGSLRCANREPVSRDPPSEPASDSFPVNVYVLDANPVGGNWRVLQYQVLGLTTSSAVRPETYPPS